MWGKVPNAEDKRPCFVYSEVPAFLHKTVHVAEDHSLVLWLFVNVFSVLPRADIEPWSDNVEYDEGDEELVFAVEMAQDALRHPQRYLPADNYKDEIEPHNEAARPAAAASKKRLGDGNDAAPAKKAKKGTAAGKGKKAKATAAPGAKRAHALQKVREFLRANPETQHPLVVKYRQSRAERLQKKLQQRADRKGITVEQLLKDEEENKASEADAKRREQDAKAEAERRKEALSKETPKDRLVRLEGNATAYLEMADYTNGLKVLKKLMDMDVTADLLIKCGAQVSRLAELRKYEKNADVQQMATQLRSKWKKIVAAEA